MWLVTLKRCPKVVCFSRHLGWKIVFRNLLKISSWSRSADFCVSAENTKIIAWEVLYFGFSSFNSEQEFQRQVEKGKKCWSLKFISTFVSILFQIGFLFYLIWLIYSSFSSNCMHVKQLQSHSLHQMLFQLHWWETV